jgi:hypothetical protein
VEHSTLLVLLGLLWFLVKDGRTTGFTGSAISLVPVSLDTHRALSHMKQSSTLLLSRHFKTSPLMSRKQSDFNLSSVLREFVVRLSFWLPKVARSVCVIVSK